jgi:hypothetical protein
MSPPTSAPALSDRVPELDRAACARCGIVFACDPAGDCWCRHVEVRLPMPAAGERCLCPACLRAAAETR